uniref:Uncharacterized protein LOC100183487 n=1 Tax=Phallusia mammillata TaxID=59560 RepID=A0A6F9DIL9_9ASCI|nr:uncharacterized protein LOC100183487 [Phallusia mammillata]
MESLRTFCLIFFVIILSQSCANATTCCRRMPRVFNIGVDPSGRPIRLDVGRCSATCGESVSVRSNQYVSVLERLQERQEESSESSTCALSGSEAAASCEPSLVHVETVTINRGPKVYDVIDECECRKIPKRCDRVPKLKRFFVGTQFEATVDIGRCVGGCKKGGKACRTIRTTSKPIMGPNGVISVQSVAECKCEATCYRQHFNVAVTERKLDQLTGEFSLATKVIDVGRCVGTCEPIERCVLRAKRRGHQIKKCLMALETHDVTCSPTRIHDVTYTNKEGATEHVAQVRRCGCA